MGAFPGRKRASLGPSLRSNPGSYSLAPPKFARIGGVCHSTAVLIAGARRWTEEEVWAARAKLYIDPSVVFRAEERSVRPGYTWQPSLRRVFTSFRSGERRMRVLVVSPYPPTPDTNGLWTKAWAEQLLENGHDVRIRVAAAEEAPHCDLRPEVLAGSNVLSIRRVWNRADPGATIVAAIEREADEFRPDVAHVHFNFLTYGGAWKSLRVLARLVNELRARGITVVVTMHSIVASPLRYLAMQRLGSVNLPAWTEFLPARLGARTLGRTLRRANTVVVLTDAAYRWVIRRTRLRPPQLEYLPLGALPCEEVLPDGFTLPTTATGSVRPRVTFLGRLDPYKGVEDLIRAAEILSEQGHAVDLRVLGATRNPTGERDGYAKKLRALIGRTKGGPVTLETRFVPTTEYEQLKRDTDVFVFPFRNDGILSASGSVLDLGATSAARLVITPVPRLDEYRQLEGVFLAPEADPEGLARTIWRAAQAAPVDPRARARTIAHFLPESIALEYARIYGGIQTPMRTPEFPYAPDARAPPHLPHPVESSSGAALSPGGLH
jgi:glycosyltransferase involved in cell wall biosynthesis